MPKRRQVIHAWANYLRYPAWRSACGREFHDDPALSGKSR